MWEALYPRKTDKPVFRGFGGKWMRKQEDKTRKQEDKGQVDKGRGSKRTRRGDKRTRDIAL